MTENENTSSDELSVEEHADRVRDSLDELSRKRAKAFAEDFGGDPDDYL